MSLPARRIRARRGEGELLRDEIVAAAARLLAETGNEDEVSIRAVAQAVGVTPPSIYLHFADKTELLYAVCEERFAALARVSNEAAAGASDPLDELRRRGDAYIRFGLDNPEHYRILFMDRREPAHYDEGRLQVVACFGDLIDAVRRAMDEGLMERDDPFVVGIALWVTVHGITSLRIAKPDFPWPPVEEVTARLMRLKGIQR